MSAKVISRETLYEGALTGVREAVELDSKKRFIHETILHPGAVVMLPLLPDGRLMLVRQYRHSIGHELLEFPAGKLEKGEEVKAAAARELEEEIGYFPGELISLGTLYPAPGFSNELQHLFLARSLTPAYRPADEDEVIEHVPMTALECKEFIMGGKINDAKTIALFAKASMGGYF